jgi:hypothetical protein
VGSLVQRGLQIVDGGKIGGFAAEPGDDFDRRAEAPFSILIY